MDQRKPHIFISYVSEDSEVVKRLAERLRRNGTQVWLDRDELSPGSRWKNAIREAIREGAFFIACFSEASENRSRSYMNEEIQLALDEIRQRPADQAFFIPVRLSNIEIPDWEISSRERISDLHWVDLYRDWNDGFRKLLTVVGQVENARESSQAAQVQSEQRKSSEPSYVEKVVQIHEHLAEAGIHMAFGGALALAWCTGVSRGTIDIDMNVFVEASRFIDVVRALPKEVSVNSKDIQNAERDTQVRLWWGSNPLDIFLNGTSFHEEVSKRVQVRSFAEKQIAFLSCGDLAVFKVFFNRTKDWADLAEMHSIGCLDSDHVAKVVGEYLGPNDDRILMLHNLVDH